MTIQAVLRWQNPDSTFDLNSPIKALVHRGVVTGGELVPIVGQLKIGILPFTLLSNDGMLVNSDVTEQIAITLDQTNVICILVKHNIGSAPTLTIKAVEASAFNVLIDKADHIVFGSVTTLTPAVQVATTDISYALRDSQDRRGRSSLRGRIETVAGLPADPNFNYPGDFYVVADGLGTPPAIYAWDGLAWINITNTFALASDLAIHRANGFPNEIHLTDDQANAATGSSGAPSIFNRYVTETDTRLPTQPENDALVGSDGSPSGTNKYITQQYPVAASTILTYPAPPGASVLISAVDGPVFVGNGLIGTANKYFSFIDFASDIGYTNISGNSPKVTGIFKDIFLSVPLDPSIDADALGFYSADVYLAASYVVDTSVRLIYGKKEDLDTVNKDFTLTATPGIEIIPGRVVERVSNIKGRLFDDPTPFAEQNINLRASIDGISAYIGSVLETNVVAANEDFVRLSADPVLGPTFVRNVGVAPVYTFSNTGLVNFTYNATLGRVTFTTPVNLSGVRVGDLFQDGAGTKYEVTAVNDGADTIDIVSTETGGILPSIVVSVGTAVDGSTRINNNPRDLLLSEMKLSAGAEIVLARSLERKTNEFSRPDGNVTYGIRRHDRRFDPRVAFYGGWQNFVTATNETYVSNDGDNGEIVLTGFFTDVTLLLRRRNNSPALNVSIDHQVATMISTSALGTINASVAASEGSKLHRLVIASGLPNSRPNTVSISIASATVGTLDVFGFELIRTDSNVALLESGRAFKSAAVIKRDTIDSAVPINQLSALERGGRFTYSVATNSYGLAIAALEDLDQSNQPSGTATGAVVTVISGIGKLTAYRVNDVILVFDGATAEMRRIASITSPTITLDSATSFAATPVTIRHICSTDNTIPNTTEEDLLVQYDLLSNDFRVGTSSDFTSPDVKDRFVVHYDGHTIVAGRDIAVSSTGLAGASRAVTLASGGSAVLKLSALCTRLDLIAANDAAATATVSIDGSPAYTYTFPGTSARRHTIFFNARYQHHEVVITPASGTLAFTDIILFGPKKPALSGFQNEVADLSRVARYEASRSTFTAAPSVYPLGGVFYEASQYVSCVNGSGVNTDWSPSVDFAKGYYGRYFSTTNDDAIAEFYFLGDAFELQYVTGPDHGIFEVYVDGVALQLAGGTVVGDYTGNQVDAFSASYGRRNIGAFGLTYGYHKVEAKIKNPRTKNGFSTGYVMALTGYYICNNSGYLTYGINREGYYTSVVDLRTFVPIPIESAVAPVVDSVGRSGKVALIVSTTSLSATFAEPFPDTNYAVACVMLNTVDGSPVFQPMVITAQSAAGFTVSWNDPLVTGNYYLVYIAQSIN